MVEWSLFRGDQWSRTSFTIGAAQQWNVWLPNAQSAKPPARGTQSSPKTSPSAPALAQAQLPAPRPPSPVNLDSIYISSDTRPRVQDWEEFFVEKSRRRAETERQERRRNQFKVALATTVVVLLVVGGIVGLAMLP